MTTQTFTALSLVKSGKRVRYIFMAPAVLPLTKIAADDHTYGRAFAVQS